MASYVTTADNLVALNGTIPFNSVSIPCNKGNVVPLVPGVLNLKGNTSNRFARYEVTLQREVPHNTSHTSNHRCCYNEYSANTDPYRSGIYKL